MIVPMHTFRGRVNQYKGFLCGINMRVNIIRSIVLYIYLSVCVVEPVDIVMM